MTAEPTTLEEVELRRLMGQHNHALGRMPYGGLTHFEYFQFGTGRGAGTPPMCTFVEALSVVVGNLNRLADVLKGVAERHAAIESELMAIRAELAAAGRLGARITNLVESADQAEADNPLVGAVNRQREALEAIHALIVQTIRPDRPELEQIGTLVALALVAR